MTTYRSRRRRHATPSPFTFTIWRRWCWAPRATPPKSQSFAACARRDAIKREIALGLSRRNLSAQAIAAGHGISPGYIRMA